MIQDKSVASKIFYTFTYAFFICVLFVCVFPFFYMFSLSTSSTSAILNNRVTFLPVGFNINAYIRLMEYPGFFNAYRNTLLYTTVGSFIALSLSLLFAYPLSKKFLMGRSVILKLVIFSMFFNGGLIPNYLLIRTLGLANTVFAILVPFAINQFNLIILINFLRSIPEEIEEAAIIDGMGYFGILTRIVIPLTMPAIATIGLYTAVFFWNDWFNALLYLNTEQQPVMRILRNFVVAGSVATEASGYGEKNVAEMASKSAVILVSVIPIIILYPFLQRFFVKGLTVGSLKG